MIYHGEFERNQAVADILNALFASENAEFYDILEKFQKNNNYQELKSNVYDFLASRVPEYRSLA